MVDHEMISGNISSLKYFCCIWTLSFGGNIILYKLNCFDSIKLCIFYLRDWEFFFKQSTTLIFWLIAKGTEKLERITSINAKVVSVKKTTHHFFQLNIQLMALFKLYSTYCSSILRLCSAIANFLSTIILLFSLIEYLWLFFWEDPY